MTSQYTRECRDDLIDEFIRRVREAAVPEWTHVSGQKERVAARRKFYPIESLRRIFPIDDVKAILNHNCENCRRHLGENRAAHPSQYPADRVLRTDTTVVLFALMVMLRYPLLIGNFLISYDINSLPPPRTITEFGLKDGQFKHLPYRSRDDLADMFQEQKWQFSVPTFEDGIFQTYEKGTILPYLDEEPIGKGGFSKVFKVWIHPYYCTLSSVQVAGSAERNPGAKIFARKEIVGDDVIEFVKEKTNLERIATLKDPHLVQIQKTYQLGNKFNILFPCAKTNLFDYLRDNRWRAPQQTKISQNALWEQVLGITKALSKIINFADPEDPGKVFFGCHFDLKPQNILVYRDTPGFKDVFRITDFGQTKIIDAAFAGTTHITNDGGTDAYAPPEYLGDKQDRAYDVWSLGIIVLEVLAFTIKGAPGLTHSETGLDKVRCTREGNSQENSRFYSNLGSSPQVKPAILRWIKSLWQDPSIQDTESLRFFQNLTDLVMKMLEPQMKLRIAIDEVVIAMAAIFNAKGSEAPEVTADSLKLKNETAVVELRAVNYYPQGTKGRHPLPVPFIMVENDNHRLRTWIGSPTPVAPLCDQRKHMQLSLAYQHTRETENSAFEFSFSAVDEDCVVSLQDHSIIINDGLVARRLQMNLTGHKVSERYQLSQIDLMEWQPFTSIARSWMSNKVSKGKEPESLRQQLAPKWVELWIEKPQAALEPESLRQDRSSDGRRGSTQPFQQPSTSASDTKSSGRRANRQVNPGKQVPRGRVVIYCEDQIIILPFAQECRLRKDPVKELRMNDITFEAMDKKQKEYFGVSRILPSKEGHLPSIPMYHPVLYQVEKNGLFQCKSMVLKFVNPDDAYAFYKLYKNEKAIWLDEIKGKPAPYPSRMPGI